MQHVVTKGNLHLTSDEHGGFICQELQGLETKFNEVHKDNAELRDDLETYIGKFLAAAGVPQSKEGQKLSDEVRLAQGREIFLPILERYRAHVKGLDIFQSFMFWQSYWWFYDTELRSKIVFRDMGFVLEDQASLVEKYLVPVLPEQVRNVVGRMEAVSTAIGFGHFALMFSDQDRKIRRIVTDQRLYELHGVCGYVYLDILPDGRPVSRSVCDRGGERAFFDGIHLMSHDGFHTCAPKTVVVDGGYKVNSTHCTIINGMLYDLIDVDDAVAHTHGRTMFGLEFSNAQHVESFKVAEESGKMLLVRGDEVILGSQTFKPVGKFLPGKVTLLDSGFARYEWSEFKETFRSKYQKVLVVDDLVDWETKVIKAFEHDLPQLSAILTRKKAEALENILAYQPDAVVLDIHLTEQEEFDGLWIANQLFRQDFQGDILIASSYGEKQLQAFQKLIVGPIHIPGKNIDRLAKCLSGKCNCL